MKTFQVWLDEFYASYVPKQSTSLRFGQMFINYLNITCPELYCSILKSCPKADCYYDDNRFSDAIKFLSTNWNARYWKQKINYSKLN